MDGPHDLPDLRRALERAQDRLEIARFRAEAARREYFWGSQPAGLVRDAFHAAMREEADALLALDAARKALEALSAAAPRSPSPTARA